MKELVTCGGYYSKDVGGFYFTFKENYTLNDFAKLPCAKIDNLFEDLKQEHFINADADINVFRILWALPIDVKVQRYKIKWGENIQLLRFLLKEIGCTNNLIYHLANEVFGARLPNFDNKRLLSSARYPALKRIIDKYKSEPNEDAKRIKNGISEILAKYKGKGIITEADITKDLESLIMQ